MDYLKLVLIGVVLYFLIILIRRFFENSNNTVQNNKSRFEDELSDILNKEEYKVEGYEKY